MLTLLRRHLLLTLVLALAYGAAARVGLWLTVGPAGICAVWPAAGLALAAFLVFGGRALAGIAAGMFCSNWFLFVGAAIGLNRASAVAALALTLAGLLQAGLAARALAGFPERVRTHPARQTLRFVLTTALCCLVACSVGEATLWTMHISQRAELFFGWAAWWVGDFTGMLVIAPGMLLLMHPRLREDRLAVQAFPLMCLGLGLTLFSTFAVGIGDRDARIARFDADVGRLAMTLQNHVELAGRDLETLQRYFYKVDLDADEFRAVSTPLLARSPWQATFEWLPRIERAARESFETSPAGLGGLGLREVDPAGAVVRAGERNEYFPVAWTDPASGRETLIGLDLASDRQRGAALAIARHTGVMAASPPLSLTAYSPDERVVQTLYAPISDKSAGAGQRYEPARVRGMVGATIDLARLFQAALDQMGTRDATVQLYDPDSPASIGLEWRDGRPVRAVGPEERERFAARLDRGVSRRLWIKVADRRWGLVAQPAWASTMPQPGWLQMSVLCSGLVFTALLTGFMVVRRRRDEVLQGAREQLELQVHARTQDLATTNRRLLEEIAGHRHTENLLQDARQHAESANRAKSLFLANMSHEIRTPLNAVLGYTQLLIEDKRQSAVSLERLRIIYAAGQRLLGLINDVLDLAKIEAGGLQVHAEPIDLRRELEEIGTLFAPRAQAKGLELRIDIDLDNDRALTADRAKFGQIVLNLLGNALKFTDTGRIVMSAWRAGDETFVEVTDTGPGMDTRELATLFTAFRQGSAGVDKGGTGLGLNLSQNIAIALGGELTIASTKGEGTRVCLRLPMAEVEQAAAPARSFKGGQRLAPGTSLRVLVVEDDAHSRDVLVTLLADAGCEVTQALDGQAGLEACIAAADAHEPFAIVFSDIRMPRLDGLQMLQALRADERTRALAMVAVSASSLEHERRYYIAQGFEDFVSKPYDFEAIYAMLALYAGASLVTNVDPRAATDADQAADAAMPEPATARSAADVVAADAARRAAVRMHLRTLGEGAADGAVAPVRQALQALAAAGAGALPAGWLAQVESDLRQYDFPAIEGHVRELLDAPEPGPAASAPSKEDIPS